MCLVVIYHIRLRELQLQSCSHSEIAKRIGYVPQVSSGALSGTVIDFILLGRRQ